MKKQYLALIVLFFFQALLYSQSLNQPSLNFSHACISDSFRNFGVGFSFAESSFASGNTFYVELSDANGDFTEAVTLATITDKNSAFEFNVSLEFPFTLSGDAYRIRLRSTLPAMVSEPSVAFEAYYVSSEQLILNNYEVSAFCAAETTLLELNADVAASYSWYKDGQLFAETTDPFLEVDLAGNYYAEPNLGACSGSLISNIVTVEALATIDVTLASKPEILACSNQEVELRAENDDVSYSYQWYRNGVAFGDAQTGNSLLRFTASENTYGDYYLEASNEFGCSVKSNTISVYGSSTMVVSEISPLKTVILGDAFAGLQLEANRPGLHVVWYKNGVVTAEGIDLLSLSVSEEGVYYAELNDPEGCASQVITKNFEVYEPQSFVVEIGFAPGYEACEVTAAVLGLQRLTGVLSNGDEIAIGSDLFHNFQFSWFRDDVLTGNTTAEFPLNDHTFSGSYSLETTYKSSTYSSAMVDAYIGLPQVTLVQNGALTCTEPAALSVDAFEEVIYSWYKDNELLYSGIDPEFLTDQEGSYRVEVAYNGCLVSSEAINVVSEADALVTIYPGERITVIPGKNLEVTASGAQEYLWTNAGGEVLSNGETLVVDQEGTYYLEAISGGCNVQKSVEVYYDFARAIPNVVTPNNDAINDRWVLPGKLLEDPELEVVICDAYGQPILKTRNYDNSWPQSTDQLPARESNFYYILNKGGISVQKGVITVVR